MKFSDVRDHLRKFGMGRGRRRAEQPGLDVGIAHGKKTFELVQIGIRHGRKPVVREAPDQDVEFLGSAMPRAPSGTPASDLDILAHGE